MEIEVKRYDSNKTRTIGKLYIDGKFASIYTLEDPIRKKKIAGDTAIPAGRYKVTADYSPRLKRVTPLLHSVPEFEGVRIHSGNTTRDTKGCLLVGLYRGEDVVLDSRLAFDGLLEKILKAAEAHEEIWITIG